MDQTSTPEGEVMSARSGLEERRRSDDGPRRKRGARARPDEHSGEILREGRLCHVGFIDDGAPIVMPMAYGLLGGDLVVHGRPGARVCRALRSAPVCVTVTLLDGLVLARSAFEHSMNYRSVLVSARARWIRDPSEKLAALRALSEQQLSGRWDDVRPPDAAELKRTHVFRIPLAEAVVRTRSGPPRGDEDDTWPAWRGVLPLRQCVDAPIPADGDGPAHGDRPAAAPRPDLRSPSPRVSPS